jgi:hypothetical protein
MCKNTSDARQEDEYYDFPFTSIIILNQYSKRCGSVVG